MHPVLLRIPFLNWPIYSYGVLVALGVLCAIRVFVRNGERDGMDSARLYNLATYTLLASLLGSRLLLVITEWDSFAEDWRKIFSLDIIRSLGVFYGGLLVGLGVIIFASHRYGYSWWRLGDALAPGVALGQSFGRLGCFASGCCWGKPTALPWGVRFPEVAHEFIGTPSGIPLHPTQLYESAGTLALFFLLMAVLRRRTFTGQVALTYLILYGVMRFSIEFLRDDWRGWVGPLSTSQFISIVLVLFAVIAFYTRKHRVGAATVSQAALQ